MDYSFWKGKRVFLTGHTGFKGAWLCRILINMGAVITGYSLEPQTAPNLFSICGVEKKMSSVIGDVRNIETLTVALETANPEIVIHMAAQPIVRESYRNPVYTYDVNVMGTVNILECVRLNSSVRSFLNITTDKVYQNNEWEWGYRETDPLDGFDPYSNSKSCSDIITHCYKNSFFTDGRTAISIARAGNVIGGGDFATDRILPDCIKAAVKNEPIAIRNPYSVRPYQHVLEPLFAYLMIAQKQYESLDYTGCYNVGPGEESHISTGELTDLFCNAWGEGQIWENKSDGGPHEANFLKLDCSKIRTRIGWRPQWHITEAVKKTVEWTRVYLNGGDIGKVMDRQIAEYVKKEE
jgi:CDP-glucose 4,6-dehydratase